MKKIILTIIIILITVPIFAEKMRVAVMDFKGDGVSKATSRKVSELIRGEMINSGEFIVIERGQMAAILEEQGLQQSGCTDISCAVELGKMLSAKKMLVGTVMKMGESVVISGRIVDVEKGVGEFSQDHKAESEMELYMASKEFAQKLTIRIMKGVPKGGKIRLAYDDTWWFGVGWGVASIVYGTTVEAETGSNLFYKEELEHNVTSFFNFNITYKQRVPGIDLFLFGVEIALSHYESGDEYSYKYEGIRDDETNQFYTISINHDTQIFIQVAIKPRVYLSTIGLFGWERDWFSPYLGISIAINSMDSRLGSWKNSETSQENYNFEDKSVGGMLTTIAPFLGIESSLTSLISIYGEAGFVINDVEDSRNEVYVGNSNMYSTPYIKSGLIWNAGIKLYF